MTQTLRLKGRKYRENPSKGFIPPVVVENWAKGALNPNKDSWERNIYLAHLEDLRIYVNNVLTEYAESKRKPANKANKPTNRSSGPTK